MIKHTVKFYRNKYIQLKYAVQREGGTFYYRNLEAFVADWQRRYDIGIKKIYESMKYDAKYATDYKTASAEYKATKELGLKVSLETIKKMSTQEFADLPEVRSAIYEKHRQGKLLGVSVTETAKNISQAIFGSP